VTNESAVNATPVRELLRRHPAVILERIAYGAGNTSWYYCGGVEDLQRIVSRFRPGSAVTFYFDGRIERADYSPDSLRQIESLFVKADEIVVGALAEDGISIEVGFPASMAEVEEQLAEAARGSVVFFRLFPGRENDGRTAVTLDMPDADGVVRPHPH